MRKFITILTGLLISLSTLGQVSHSISFNLRPLISYRYLNSNDNGNIKNKYIYFDATQLKNRFDTLDQPMFNYGIAFNYNLEMKKITLTTGIEYIRVGEFNEMTLMKGYTDTISGNIVHVYDGYGDFKFKYLYNYLCLPLKFSYKLIHKSWEFSFQWGVNINFLIHYQTIYPDNLNQLFAEPFIKPDITSENKFVFGATGGISLTKQLNDKYSLTIAPDFFLQLTPSMTIEKELRQHNYYGGLNIGIKRKI
jgi:hypothetical protein